MLFHRLLQTMPQWVPSVVFLHSLLKFKPFDEFFPFQNVIANLCVSTSIKYRHLSSYHWHFFQCILQKMVGWVALRFVIAFRWSLNHLKCDGQCLFLSYRNSCSACEMSFLTGKECHGKCAHCRSPHQKKFMYIYSQGQLICFVSFKNQN